MRPPRSGAGAGGFLHIRTVRRDSSMTRFSSRLAAAFGVALALGVLIADPADARRGGSFGSRGMRTYSAPRSTATAPGYVAPVQRSMTPNTGAPNTGFNGAGAYAPRPG